MEFDVSQLGFGTGTRAPWAADPWASRGRLVAEPVSPTRSEFQRDRDRIIHTTAFRRLKHKTQVFVAHEGDHYRTRLTHTIEVAQIARALARALRLDEDLAEGVALVHRFPGKHAFWPPEERGACQSSGRTLAASIQCPVTSASSLMRTGLRGMIMTERDDVSALPDQNASRRLVKAQMDRCSAEVRRDHSAHYMKPIVRLQQPLRPVAMRPNYRPEAQLRRYCR